MRHSIEMLARRVIAIPKHPIPSRFQVLPRFCSSSSSSSSASPSSKLSVGGLNELCAQYNHLHEHDNGDFDMQDYLTRWTNNLLKDAFSSFGEVQEVRIAYDKGSGRSRGFGFVDFADKDDALSAKHAMDGKGLLGRPLRIGFALERVRGGPVVVPRFGKPKSDSEKVFK